MAKVTGPLLSFDASGTVGSVATYSKWKGRNYTRLRVVPQNVQSENQAEVRTIFGAVGKNNKQIELGSDLETQITAVTPQDQSWTSYFAKEIIGSNHANFDASKAAYENVSNATVAGYFDAAAPDAGLTGFELPYGTPQDVTAGLQLWAAADAAFRLGLAIAPVAAVDMSESQVDAFAAAYLAA